MVASLVCHAANAAPQWQHHAVIPRFGRQKTPRRLAVVVSNDNYYQLRFLRAVRGGASTTTAASTSSSSSNSNSNVPGAEEESTVESEDEEDNEYLNYFNSLVAGETKITKEDEEKDDDNNNNNNEEEPQEQREERLQKIVSDEKKTQRRNLQKWRLEQQQLMQLRSTLLSEALAQRGIPLASLMEVATPEGQRIPEPVDWDCCMSTRDKPKTCLYSFDAEPDTKVVAPIDTEQWISLSALNRLRRTDPTKVEPMWHSQYAILQSWFGENSEYSMLHHVGFKGLLLSLLLQGPYLKVLLSTGIVIALVVFMPVIEFFVNRFLVSGLFWLQWSTWGPIVRAALPFKLFLAQMGWTAISRVFGKLEGWVRDAIVDWECELLEASIPLTVGPGSQPVDEVQNGINNNIDDGEDDKIDELVSSLGNTDNEN